MTKPMTEFYARSQSGFGLVEALVAMVLLAIVSISLQLGFTTSLAVAKMTEVHNAASSIAAGRIESIAALDPANITTSFNESNTAVTWPGLELSFQRSTTVVVNADNSRTVTVQVASVSENLPASVEFTTTFAVWE